MNRTTLIKILALILSLCSMLFVFTACGGGDEPVTCEHEWSFDKDNTVYATTKKTGTTAYKCAKCKQSKTETMDKLIYLNGIESLATESYGIKVTNLSFTETYRDETEGFAVEVAQLLINVDSQGNITGEGETVVELNLDGTKVYLDAKAYVNNDGVYVYFDASMSETFSGTNRTYLNIPFNALMVDAGAEAPAGMTLEELLELYEQELIPLGLDWFETEIASKLENNALFQKLVGKTNYEINNIIGKLINKFFTAETKNGLTTYTLSVGAFKDFNRYLYETKLETLVNKMLGKDAYKGLEEEILGLFDLSFGEILDGIAAYGISIPEFVEAYDELGYELYQILDDNGMDVGEYQDLSTLLGVDIVEYIEDETFRATTIGGVVEMMLEAEESEMTLAELKSMISDGFAYAKEMTIYDFIAGEEYKQEAKEEVDAYIDLIGSYGSISFSMDKDGVMKQFDFTWNYREEYEEEDVVGSVDFSGTISFINGLTVESDADEIVAEYEALEDSLVFTEGKVSFVPNTEYDYMTEECDFTYENGKLTGVTVTEVYAYTSYSVVYTHKYDIDFDKAMTIIREDCDEYLYISVQFFGVEVTYTELDAYENPIMSTEHTTEDMLYISYNLETGEAVFYTNSWANEISKHNVGANGICSNCGEYVLD